MKDLIKYVRTPHLRGSRKSGDDYELEDHLFEDVLIGHYVVYEAKIDGSNVGISFDEDGSMLLQSRGHYLRGGAREKEFTMFKCWANMLKRDLFDVLGKRYIMYLESVYAKHTVFYDNLPNWCLEFDVFDLEKKLFLSTSARKQLLEGLNYTSVPIVYAGPAIDLKHLKSFIGSSQYKTSSWKINLRAQAEKVGYDPDLAVKQTDPLDDDEGIYIKVETESETIGRFKFVRESFTNEILQSGSHWHDRPIIPNLLAQNSSFIL